MNYVVCLSSTSSSCHVTVMGSLIVLVNKRADWNVPVSLIKCMSPCSVCDFSTKKTSKVNTILKVVIFKHSAILFRCSMICRWPEPWNCKTNPIDFQGQRSMSQAKIFTAYHLCEHYWINILQWILTRLGTYIRHSP